MKRLITFISLIVIVFLGYTFIMKGVNTSKVKIASLNTVKSESDMLTKKLATYDKMNDEQYEAKKASLDSNINTYKNSKIKYEKIVEELAEVINNDPNSSESEAISDVIYSDQEVYPWDFILVTLGNYGLEHGVDVNIDVATSGMTSPTSTLYNFFLGDITFTVTGSYKDVSDYIAELENDERLLWEINDFSMQSGSSNGYSGVSGKFTVKGIPIDSQSYLESIQTDNPGDTDANNTNTVTNTVEQNVVNNTVTNTVDNTVANTVSNSISNNTVN